MLNNYLSFNKIKDKAALFNKAALFF